MWLISKNNSGSFQMLNITHERLSTVRFLDLFEVFMLFDFRLPPLGASPVSSLFSPPLSVFGQSLTSEFPPLNPVSRCLLIYFANFN